MTEIRMRGQADVDQVFTYLDRILLGHATTCEAAGTYGTAFGEARVILRVYEKYYMRTSSRASLTVLFTASGGITDVEIISSGGSGSPIMKFSWGAEENFLQVAIDALVRIGFAQVQ